MLQTNPSILEKSGILYLMNSDTESEHQAKWLLVSTSETIEFDIMAVGVRSDLPNTYDVFADVVEVWGAPPPDGYKRDVDSGNFTIHPYYDFELDVCDAILLISSIESSCNFDIIN